MLDETNNFDENFSMADNASYEEVGVAADNNNNPYYPDEYPENEYPEDEEGSGLPDDNNATVADNNGYDVTKTKAFSQRLNEISKKRVDEVYESFGWTNPFTGEAIKSKADYDNYKYMQESYENGQDPRLMAEINSLKSELASYKISDADAKLLTNPEEKDFYATVRDECMALVDFASQRGINIGLNDAYNTIKARNFNTYLANAQKLAEERAVQRINALNQGSVGSLATPEVAQAKSVSDMNYAEIESLAEKVLKGEKIKL